MNVIKSQKSISIQLNKFELWFLVGLFGPGWVFGIDNPTEGLENKKIEEKKKEALENFESSGLIKSKGGNQLQIDEMLGGMAYSLVHADNLIVVKNIKTGFAKHFFFLPQWQLELSKIDTGYQITYLRKRSNFIDSVLSEITVKLPKEVDGSTFHIIDRYYELAVSKFELGEKIKAKQIFEEYTNEDIDTEAFIQPYLNPEYHFAFDLLIGLNNKKLIADQKYELIQINGIPYWISYDPLGESDKVSMSFTPVTASEVKNKLNQMLPKE